MVRQAGERLRADHVRASLFDKLEDLGGEQPAFAGLHADRRDLGSLLDEFGHRIVLLELAVRGGDGRLDRRVVAVEAPTHERVQRLVAAGAEILLVPVGDVRARGHELHDAGHHGLAILRFDDVDDMVVRIRLVFDEDLADHADAHLARHVLQRQSVEALHDLSGEHGVRQVAALEPRGLRGRLREAVVFERLAHDHVPLLVQAVRRALLHLVRAHAVQALHEQVAEDQRLDGAVQQRGRHLEARIVLQALRGDRDDRDLRVTRVDQGLADQAEVVGGSAHAAGLRNRETHLVWIVFAFENRVDELSDDHDGRIAGVVVHVFEASLHVFARGVLEDVELVAAGADHRFDEGEVDRAHLRGDDRVVLLHVLDELLTVRVTGHGRVVVAGLRLRGLRLGVRGIVRGAVAERGETHIGDVALRGALGRVAHRLGELRVRGHRRVEQDLTARRGRLGAGLAESGGLRRVRGGGGVAAGIGRVHGPVGGLNLRFGGGDGGLRFGERGLRGGEIGFGLLLRLAGGGLRGGVSRVARGVGLGGTGLVGRGERGLGHARLVRLAFLDGGLERAQADLRRAEVGDLVDLEQRVHVGLVGEDLGHLVGGDGVEAAAERVELHEFEARIGGDEVRGRVEARMVGPLVGDAQRHAVDGDLAVVDVAESVRVLLARVLFAFGQEVGQVELLPRLQFADRILGEDDHAERADGFGDAVVDFRVDVVGASGKHDAAAVVLLHVGEGFEAFLLDVVFEDLVFGVGGLDSSFGLFAADARPCELLDDTVDHELVVGEVEVRVHVAHVGVTQFGHVRADDERIVGDDRAVVVVVRVGHEVVLVTDARVEDRLHALVEKPFDVAVHELGRVADVLGGDRFDAGFEQFVAGTAGDHHLETERGEQREPERVVLVHVERARNANLASGGVLVGEAAVGEAALVLVVVQVRTVGAFLLGIAAAFATVAGHEAGAVGERGDGELAVVLAQLAHVAFGGHRHFVEGFAGED